MAERTGAARGGWPHVRAALIVLHLLAVTLMALPAPVGGLDRRTWKEPTVQAEFASWRARLASVGVVVDARAFEDQLYAWMSALLDARNAAIAPFRPYYLYCGTWQSWRMFVAPHTHPARLQIDVHEGDAWRTVFRERSDEATWLRYVLEQDRLRGMIFRYSWENYRGRYKELVRWIAVQAARDFPDADKVRVRYEKTETRSAEAIRVGVPEQGEWTQSQTVALAELRP